MLPYFRIPVKELYAQDPKLNSNHLFILSYIWYRCDVVKYSVERRRYRGRWITKFVYKTMLSELPFLTFSSVGRLGDALRFLEDRGCIVRDHTPNKNVKVHKDLWMRLSPVYAAIFNEDPTLVRNTERHRSAGNHYSDKVIDKEKIFDYKPNEPTISELNSVLPYNDDEGIPENVSP